MDFNAHVGREIPNNPHELNRNGRKLLKLIKKRDLELVNKSELCEGLITRTLKTKNGTENSIVDYVLLTKNLVPFLVKMSIDDKREKALTNFGENKKHLDIFYVVPAIIVNF